MKYTLVRFVACAALAFVGSTGWGSDQKISVPPNFTAPQEQASNLAAPTDAPPPLKTVITIVLCNKVVGLIGVDEIGEAHAAHFKGKDDVVAIQKAVRSDHNLEANLGCSSDKSKDVTVL